MLNKVEICGVNTSKLPVLSNDKVNALFLRAKAGDEAAREELISGNLRLVLSVIQRFHNRGENADDLFQVGCIGLIKSIDNFDLSQNVRLSTYAVPMNMRGGERKITYANANAFRYPTQSGAYPQGSLKGGISTDRGCFFAAKRKRRNPLRPRPLSFGAALFPVVSGGDF